MKHTLTLLMLTVAILSGCKDHDQHPAQLANSGRRIFKFHPGHHHGYGSADSTADCLCVDTANIMINSYLNSINYQVNDTDIRSFSYDADSLRAYLANTQVKHLKFMLAHTMAYIDSGGQNQPCGYQSGALTLVIAGYGEGGNYIFFYYPAQPDNAMVDDNMSPCPQDCPAKGTASSDTLVCPDTHHR